MYHKIYYLFRKRSQYIKVQFCNFMVNKYFYATSAQNQYHSVPRFSCNSISGIVLDVKLVLILARAL